MNRVLKNCPVCKTLDHPKAEAKGHICSPCAVERSRTWYKENPELNIKRIVGDYHYMKRLDLRDSSLSNKELMSNFKDPNVIKYFAASDKDARTQQQVINYGRRS